ncbi:TPA: N-acetylneuraminate synthase family protein [Candidatus Scatousia excrementigallinarum]|uniref:N-acetylneuraminate synthase family protein n=1 Tax=Candidatus Scatousia excrementigallinarum TaxID=2840935 RepID=A0A9D1JP68_9BACT|nr:N-acetylneuraminate synthase family protein [Candidatus Scatousia excrementigallinarum]
MKFAKEIFIGKRRIALDEPAYFIADIAANHDGDLERAKNLIYLAKEAGADCAKFQHFLAEKIVSDYGFKHLGGEQSHQKNWKKSVFNVYKEYECRREWNDELIKTCNEVGIEFMTTPYDYAAVDEIESFVDAIKIGSGDITWIEFLEYVAKIGKPVLLACGASDMEDTERAVVAVEKYNSQVILMQCNTNYTAELENFKYINLNALNTFKEKFPGILLGLSDHTKGYSTVLGAVALGARVIEKHFTDDNSRIGPDHHFAMNPKTWKDMVGATRELEAAMGDGIKRIEYNERDTVVIQRRAIRLKFNKAKGDIICEDDIEYLRPAPVDSYSPYEKEFVLSKKLLINKNAGDYIKKGDLCD